MTKRQDRAAGFTLLETLVAMALLGIVLSSVFAVIGNGLRRAQQDEDRLLLALFAHNLLVRSRLDLRPAEGTIQGTTEDGLAWRIESAPYPLPEPVIPERRRDPFDAGPLDAGPNDRPLGEIADRLSPASGSEAAESEPRTRSTSEAAIGAARDDEPGLADPDQRDEEARRRAQDKVKLRRVQVVVERAGERFELTGLAAEPRQAAPRSALEPRDDARPARP